MTSSSAQGASRSSIGLAARLAGLAILVILSHACTADDIVGPPPAGSARISGTIRDSDGTSVPDASILIPFGDGLAYTVNTDGRGRFSMLVPAADFAGVSPVIVFAIKDGYRPLAAWYESLEDGRSYNFNSTEVGGLTTLGPGEYVPAGLATLVHVGDDSYGGEINSQLQVVSRGISVGYKITTWTSELAATATSATVRFLARGVQADVCPLTQVALGSPLEYVPVFLQKSAADGGFTGYTVTMNLPSIQVGMDIALFVASGWCMNEYDDFEVAAVSITFN